MSAQGKENDKMPKHDSKISFYNKNGDEIGVMDFAKAYLSFEGNAEESAIEFMDAVAFID